MIIHTFGGQANIMGKDTGFIYDGKASELRIQGLSFEDAHKLLSQLEGATPVKGAMATALIFATGGGGGGGKVAEPAIEPRTHIEKAPESTPEPEKPAGKPVLAVDPERMKAIAAGSPQKEKAEKPPRERKPREPKKEPTPAPEPEPAEAEVANDTEVEEEPEVADVVESKSASKANGTNGAAKAAPKNGVPQELVEARKLGDVIRIIKEMDKIDFGEAGSDERDEAVDKLKQRCGELKDSVPCLARINDLDARIDRTIEVMDMHEDVS